MTTTPRNVVRIPEGLRARAASLLLSEASGRGQEAAGRLMVESAGKHGIDLSRLWGAIGPRGEVRAACLVVPGAGRTAVAFTSAPPPNDEGRLEEMASVIEAACGDLDPPSLAQALLEPTERGAARAFERAGFVSAGTLEYMRRAWSTPGEAPRSIEGPWGEGVRVEHVSRSGDGALGEALGRSYEGTLDCPELCGLREARDVIASHRATGRHDPALWWMARLHERPAGALLLNPCPEQGHVELVYLGICPELRGTGLATRLLRFGLHRLEKRRERTATCAVDARNIPARRLYEREGFGVFAERLAYVRPVVKSR